MKRTSRIAKLLVLIVVLASFAGMLAVSASAETLIADLIYVDDWMNLAIQVVYDDRGTDDVPEISFINPVGQEYKVGVSPESDITAEYSENAILFLIPNARPGQWQICYDSAFSGRLQVTCSPYSRQIDIESFAITDISSSYAGVEFAVGFDEDIRYNYIISAVVTDADGNIESRRELTSGRGYANNGLTFVRVPIYGLASFDNYRLLLEVYTDDHGIETSDTALSEPFAYVDPDAPSALGDFYITLDRTGSMLYLDWSNVDTWRADEYIVAVFSGENLDEPIYYESMDSDITSASALVDPSAGMITVHLYWRDGDALSDVTSVSFDPMQIMTSMDCGEATASAQAKLNYAIPAGRQVLFSVQVNDQEPMQLQLEGSSSLAVTLAQGENTVCVSHWLSDYICIVDTFEVFSDRHPPMLSFFEDPNGVTTDQLSFQLTGITEAGATLSINGEAVQINADGTFAVTLDGLKPGENLFEIVSSDPLGNQIRRTVIINCEPEVEQVIPGAPGWMQYLPLMISAVVALLISILVVLIKGKQKELTLALIFKRCAIAAWALTILFAGITLWVMIQKLAAGNVVQSTKFFDYVRESIQQAYEILTDFQRYSQLLGILLIVTLVFAGLAVILTLVALLMGRKRKPKAPKPSKEKKGAKAASAPEEAPAAVTEPISAAQPEPDPEPESNAQPIPEPVVKSAPVPEPVAESASVPEPIPAPAAEPVVAEPAPARPPVAFCSNCGAKRVEGAAFCIQCGYRFE